MTNVRTNLILELGRMLFFAYQTLFGTRASCSNPSSVAVGDSSLGGKSDAIAANDVNNTVSVKLNVNPTSSTTHSPTMLPSSVQTFVATHVPYIPQGLTAEVKMPIAVSYFTPTNLAGVAFLNLRNSIGQLSSPLWLEYVSTKTATSQDSFSYVVIDTNVLSSSSNNVTNDALPGASSEVSNVERKILPLEVKASFVELDTQEINIVPATSVPSFATKRNEAMMRSVESAKGKPAITIQAAYDMEQEAFEIHGKTYSEYSNALASSSDSKRPSIGVALTQSSSTAKTAFITVREVFDIHKDNKFDPHDTESNRFNLWQDESQDCTSQSNEVKSLSEAGLIRIDFCTEQTISYF